MNLNLDAIIKLISLAVTYGIPAVTSAVDALKSTHGREPTVEEIAGLLEGVEPPEEF